MKILWVNSATTMTLSNTRLFGLPPIFKGWGHPTRVLIGGKRSAVFPDYFITIPVPLGRIGLYQRLVTLCLPWIIFKLQPDVIITDWMSARLARGVVLLRKLGIWRGKLVHDVRTVPVKEDRGKSFSVYAGSLNFARRHFDGLTTITEPLRDEICSHFDFQPNEIAVWTSGVDVGHFRPRDSSDLRRKLGLEDKFVVFYHGAVNENRGVLELAGAARFLRDLPQVRFLIVGGGNQWEALEEMVKEDHLDHVFLKPGVPYTDIPRWISLGDLCAVPLPDHPWWRVSSPLKLMEYLAMEKPVLLTEMKAHRAILPNDDDGFYVAKADPQTFAEGIRRAYEERDRFPQMGRRGRQLAQSQLNWEKQAEILRDYLEKVVAGSVQIGGVRR
jgi:glycosyltransferase involved in cell wall biosynthesis